MPAEQALYGIAPIWACALTDAFAGPVVGLAEAYITLGAGHEIRAQLAIRHLNAIDIKRAAAAGFVIREGNVLEHTMGAGSIRPGAGKWCASASACP